jgi:glycosyltransferase involved in cell wall biosynthesis
MTSLPTLTVITPSYNQGEYVESTIRSVLEQGYPNLEYIVVDGGSTDATLRILQQYESGLRWVSERDGGQSDAINKGLRMASGEIVAFLNSDDTYEPGALLKVGQFFATHPQAHWLTGKCHTIDRQGKRIRQPVTLYKNLWLRLKSYRALTILNYISQPATFWRRTVIDVVGPFDESLRYAMDYDYHLRVGRRFKLWVLDDYLASFRVHPHSKAGSSASAQFVSDLEIARSHTKSKLVLWLHAGHNILAVNIYRLLLWAGRSLPMGRRNQRR